MDKLGPKLVVHDRHGYSHWDKPVPTPMVVRGRRIVGIYFSADWGTPCVQFTPLLMNLHASHRAKNTAATTSIPPFEVILISRCQDDAATEHYFSAMPWTAMPHADPSGPWGAALMEEFGVTLIPALILLDGEGAVVCRNGQEQLRADPTGCDFPWTTTTSRTPRVGFDLTAHTRPDVARLARPVQPPTMKQPPKFQRRETPEANIGKKWPEKMFTMVGDQGTTPPGKLTGKQMGSPAGKLLEEGTGTQVTLPSAKKSDRKRPAATPHIVPGKKPPPKPNLGNRGGNYFAAPEPTEGKPTSLMQPQPLAEVHPFASTLKEWQQGIVVDCGPDWTWDVIKAAVARGPHPTATTPKAIALFKEDIVYQVKAGFSRVVLWEDLQRLRPANLKYLPIAVVPQTGRRGRIILDLSIPVYQEINGVVTVTQESVNSTIVLKAPSIPVKEIGKVLPCMLQYMQDTPAGLHILFSKLDISDGFWRLIVQWLDSYNVAYVLPQEAS